MDVVALSEVVDTTTSPSSLPWRVAIASEAVAKAGG